MIDGDSHPRAEATANRITGLFHEDWLDGLILDPPEKRFIDAPFGTIAQSQRIEASWLIENAAVLAWSIKLSELPPFYEKVNGAALSKALGGFQPGHSERIAEAAIRDPNEIVAGIRTYAALWWRLNEYRKTREPIDLQAKLTAPGGHHLTADGIQLLDRDLAVNGKPLNEVSEDCLRLASGIVHQRYREFRKLLGFEGGGSRITNVN